MQGLPLDILCCPETRLPLRPASQEEIRRFGADLDAALVRADGLVLYPVRAGIPLLVKDAALRAPEAPGEPPASA